MRRSTGIYILLLAALAGFYYYLNNRPQSADIALEEFPTPAPVEYLFAPEDGLPSMIRVRSNDGQMVQVQRNAENIWVFTLPIEAPADQGLVESAASQVSTLRVLDHIPGLEGGSVGLSRPAYSITMQLTSGLERTVDIGVLTPTGTGYYAREGAGEVFILSNSAVDALIGLLTNPPYQPTETPLPSSLDIGPALEATSTPQP